jgi:hypothetical protein
VMMAVITVMMIVVMMMDDGDGSCAVDEDDHNNHRHQLLGPITNSTFCHAIPQVRYYYYCRRLSDKELMLTSIVVVYTLF